MIRVLRPTCTNAEIREVNKVLRSNWWGNGPKCEEFENEVAGRMGYEYCVTVNSATAALHLALLAAGVKEGDEVIVPALTFVSTALAVLYCGATPVFADVNKDILCIDWEDVTRKTTPKTKAIIPVDFAGYSSYIMGLPVNKKWIIQDAAHSFGGLAYGDMVCYSFHPVKPIATGDGGAILTDEEEIKEKLLKLRWCGIDRSTWARAQGNYSWDYMIESVGYKYHWNDIQAAIGLAQLKNSKKMLARRVKIADYYTSNLFTAVDVPMDSAYHTWHLFIIRVPDRDDFIKKMNEKGVEVGVHYKPITHYSKVFTSPTPPVTEMVWPHLVSIPMYSGLTDAEVEQVVEAVKDSVK